MYFALNFGDEGGAPVKAWTYRACLIQGSQQIYVVALWYWGSTLSKLSSAGRASSSILVEHPQIISGIGLGVGSILWIVGVIVFLGLPDYYRQQPGKVPDFYTSIFRRNIVLVSQFLEQTLSPFIPC